MIRAVLTFSLAVLLAGCATAPDLRQPPPPPARAAEPTLRPPLRSASSYEIERFFQKVETGLLARGLLRDDGGGPDTPFDAQRLADSFMTLAFSEEYSGVGNQLVRRSEPSALHRWRRSVRIEPVFGASVDPSRAERDRATIGRVAALLASTTRHPVAMDSHGGNFQVLILNDQELRAAGPELRRLIPGISPAQVAYVEQIPRETYCVVFASDPGEDGTYQRAVAVIRAELPERLRISCLHEEIAQGLGLSDDSPFVRPSIFNDDDEFGRLTDLDLLLLRILYDPRLRPGMPADEAEPIVRRIADDIMATAT